MGENRSTAIPTCPPIETNAPLFELIDHAEDWLAAHKKINPVLKWDTRAWGEIPADFNRK